MKVDGNWSKRLKESREKVGLTLTSAAGSPHDEDYISRQTLTSYEKGTTYPDVPALHKLCRLYATSADYIIFGRENDPKPYLQSEDTMLNLYMLMYSNKISLDGDGNIAIIDKDLKTKVMIMKEMADSIDLSSYENMQHLLDGIKKLSKERI